MDVTSVHVTALEVGVDLISLFVFPFPGVSVLELCQLFSL